MDRILGKDKKTVKQILADSAALLITLGIVAWAALAVWIYYFRMPCRVLLDCREYGVDTQQMKAWMEREKDSYSGILDMAGWKIQKQEKVSSVSTGRSASTSVSAVFGSAGLAYPAKILSGGCELSKGGQYCILTGKLSDKLFGSTDTAGELIRLGDELLVVEGVIDLDEEWLIRPIGDEENWSLDYAAFRLSCRYQAREKAENCLSGK